MQERSETKRMKRLMRFSIFFLGASIMAIVCYSPALDWAKGLENFSTAGRGTMAGLSILALLIMVSSAFVPDAYFAPRNRWKKDRKIEEMLRWAVNLGLKDVLCFLSAMTGMTLFGIGFLFAIANKGAEITKDGFPLDPDKPFLFAGLFFIILAWVIGKKWLDENSKGNIRREKIA